MKVLVVRFSSIGDIVLTSPIVRSLKLQLGAEVHFITKEKFAAVVTHNPRIDKIFTIKKEITEVTDALHNEKYDYIVDLHKNLRSKRLTLTLGVKSISFDKINIEKWLRVHTRLNFLPKLHLVDRYFSGVKGLGIHNDGEGLEYFHGLSALQTEKIRPESDYISIVLGATYFTKRIPKAKIEYILKKANLPCVLLGGNDVKNLAEELQNQYSSVINHVGGLSLNESAALVESSKFVITGDTGLMHMAAAMKVPTLVFWGSTAYELGMYPYYGDNYDIASIHMVNTDITCSPCSKIGKDKCPKGHFKCMNDLAEAEILEGLRKLEVG